jgi:hypothetical protein
LRERDPFCIIIRGGKGVVRVPRKSKLASFLPALPVSLLGLTMAASSLQACLDAGDGFGAPVEPDAAGVDGPALDGLVSDGPVVDVLSEDSPEDRLDGMSYGDGYGNLTDARADSACVSSTTLYPPEHGCPNHLWACWPPTSAVTGIPDSRYALLTLCGDVVVVDSTTHLMWSQDVQPGEYTWVDAAASCTASRRGGFSDWRLPSSNELMTLVDYTSRTQILNADVFKGPGGSTWSATVFAQQAGMAWQLYGSGGVYPVSVSTMGYARCVR